MTNPEPKLHQLVPKKFAHLPKNPSIKSSSPLTLTPLYLRFILLNVVQALALSYEISNFCISQKIKHNIKPIGPSKQIIIIIEFQTHFQQLKSITFNYKFRQLVNVEYSMVTFQEIVEILLYLFSA